jgi:hypothetical protein
MSKRFLLEADEDSDNENKKPVSKPLPVLRPISLVSSVSSSNHLPIAPTVPQHSADNQKKSRKNRFLSGDSDDDSFDFTPFAVEEKKPFSFSPTGSNRLKLLSYSDSDDNNEKKESPVKNSRSAKKQNKKGDDNGSSSESSAEEGDEDGNDVGLTLPYDEIQDDSYDVKPSFTIDFRQNDSNIALPSLATDPHDCPRIVNRYIARYLLNHQVDGVKWMWNRYLTGNGAILGDGKLFLISLVSLIVSLFSG